MLSDKFETEQVLNWYNSVYPAISKFEIDERTPEYQLLKNDVHIKSKRSWLWTVWGRQFLVLIVIPLCLSKLLLILYNHYQSKRKYKSYKTLRP